MTTTPESTRDIPVAKKVIDLTKFDSLTRRVAILDVESAYASKVSLVEVECTLCVTKKRIQVPNFIETLIEEK